MIRGFRRGFRSTAEVAHGFAREESAEVAEEDEEGGVGAEVVAQGAGREVEAGDECVEDGWGDETSHGGGAFFANSMHSILPG